MTRKKRSRQPRQEAAKASLLHEQVQKARCLSEFVKLEFEAARAPFNEEALSPELLQLLQDVKLVEKHGEHFGILSFQLGRCELPWRELLVRVRRALSSETASQLVSTPKWQQLHSLLGDGIFCKIFQRYQVYLSVGGSRWLQLTGTMVTRKNQSEGLTVTKQWTPSEIIIKRPIFYSSRFPPRTGLLHGNALRMIIRQTGAGEAGARRFIWWLLGPQFHHLDKPPSVDMAPPRDPPKRKRQRGRRRKRSPASEAERAVKQRLEKPQATASMAGLQKEVIFEALMEPVLQMLNKTSTLKCQQLLGKCCPAKDALMTVKVFEKQNHQSQGGLPSIGALRCFCGQDSQRASRPHLRCTGGAAEIRFMREFPSLSCAVSSSQVARFICEVVAEVVGPEMLGRKNWPTLARHLRMLVKLRRFEELSVHDIMQNFSVKHFKDAMIGRCLARRARQADPCSPPHLGQLRDNRAMAEVSGRLCYFIFRNLAVPLLRDHFYATEAEPGGTQTMYFRKNVWQLLQSRADCGFLHSQCLELQRKPTRFQPRRALDVKQKKQTPPRRFNKPPMVRWVPKKRGFRPVVNIAKWKDQGKLGDKQKAVLSILANVRASNPGILGQSLLNQNDVHAHLLDAISKLKTQHGGTLPHLYVMVADLRNCYDRILHEPLLQHINRLPLQERYKIFPMALQGTGRSNTLNLALGDALQLPTLCGSEACPPRLRREPWVMLPRTAQIEVASGEVRKILKSAVQGCGVVLGTQPEEVALPNHAAPIPQERRLLRGIPQGSRFSPFLCALHMGAGDAQLPPNLSESLTSGASALARLVDDFLYLSTDRTACRDFLQCLAQDNNPYGGDLNWSKCDANFAVRDTDPEPAEAKEVPWAGLTLAPAKGFLNIRHGTKRRATDGLSIKKPLPGRGSNLKVWERTIRSKLLVFLKMKLQPLLLDPRLNSDDCVKDNVMRVCRFTAWRFAWLLRRLPVVTPGFVARQVGRLVRYATRCAQAVRARFNGTPLNIKGMVRAAFRGALWPRRNTPLFKEALDELMPSRQPVVHKVGRVTGVTCDGEKAPEVLKLGRVTGVTGDGEKAPQVQKVGRVTAVTGDGEKAPQVLKVGRVTGSTFDGANAPHVQQVGRVTGVTFDGAKAPQVLKVGRVTGVTFDGANAPQAQKVGRVTGSTFDGAKASQVQKVGRVTGVTGDGANAPQVHKVGRIA